jgi:hypothetical protein
MKSYLGLLVPGKNDFHAIEEFPVDDFVCPLGEAIATPRLADANTRGAHPQEGRAHDQKCGVRDSRVGCP